MSVAKIDGRAFADQWISEWNRRDVNAVLAHFSEDIVFTSPRASAVLGTPRVEGKHRLKEYWTAALSRIQTIHFALDYVIDSGDRVGIVYTSEINGKKMALRRVFDLWRRWTGSRRRSHARHRTVEIASVLFPRVAGKPPCFTRK